MVDVAQVSFGKGEISPIAADRTDQSFYQSALATAVNFFLRREGGMSNRPGLEYIANCQSNTPGGSYMLPFIYNNQQAYLTEFAAGATGIYENGAMVGIPVTNPYQLADLPYLRWAQSADVLNVVVDTQPLGQLKRLTPTSFSFLQPQLLFGPFQDTNTDGTTTVYASGTQGTVTLTASSGIFEPGHVGALFYLQEQFLGSIQPWVADQIWANGGANVAGQLCRSDGKIYVAVGPPGNNNTLSGAFQPVHTYGTQWDGNQATPAGVPNNFQGIEWQFVSTDAGVALITGYTDSKHVTAVVQTEKGVLSAFPPTVVGGAVSVFGPFTFSGDGSTKSFGALTATTTVDPNQFYVTIGGIFQDPSLYSISAVAGNIVFYSAPAAGTNNIVVNQVVGTVNNIYQTAGAVGSPTPLKGLCLSTYWAFGSISSIQGYASDVCYFDDRLMLAATTLQPQTFFGSQVSDYLNFGVSDPQVDSDAITETLNSRQQNPIIAMIPLNQLLLGTATATMLVTNSAADGSITPSDISVVPQEFYGLADVPIVLTGSTAIYVQWGGRKVRDVVYQFLYGKFAGQELTMTCQANMFPIGTTCVRIAYAPEPFSLIYCVRSDGALCVCSYIPEQQNGTIVNYIIAWARWFTDGIFEDVCVLPEDNSHSVYVIVGRTINGVYQRYIERFAQREFATIYDEFFVDSGLTYDGRNTSATTMNLSGGTTWINGDGGTLIASSTSGWAGFVAQDAINDNVIFLYDASGNRARVQIFVVLSATEAAVHFLDPIPTTLRGVSTAVWTFARTVFSGLTNLAGQTVAVQADGAVLPEQLVSATGSFVLPNACGVVHAGLPYNAQLQSLNFNQIGEPSIRNKMKTMTRASVVVDSSAPFEVGPSFTNMVEVPLREFEDYGFPTNLATGVVHAQLPTVQSDNAQFCIQQSDPAPLTVLGWLVDLDIGEPG